jgi:diphosphomevalonate decarboxylase
VTMDSPLPKLRATAIAHPNIALIKYWGNRDDRLRLPANGSISINLDGLVTTTSVQMDAQLPSDVVNLQGKAADAVTLARVSDHLNVIRSRFEDTRHARVESENNFPMGAGIASSASGFAALTMAAVSALGKEISEREMTILARRGSGSASRSIPTGYAEWQAADYDEESYAWSIAEAEHWALVDCVAVISTEHKRVSSADGNRLANTSPYQTARVADAPDRLARCRAAIRDCDFESLATVIEADTRMMHAVMMTSQPPIFYWNAQTMMLIQEIPEWRKAGLAVAYTVDAGPNVHCICLPEAEAEVRLRLTNIPGVQQGLVARAGSGARLVNERES